MLAFSIGRSSIGKAKRAVLYLRVSTSGQTVENQRRELLAAAERHGWTVVNEFRDSGISGKNGREKRPAFDRLCTAVARRECDLVAAWSVDRLGRSLQDLIGFLGELRAKKVDLYLHQQGVDTSTPAGKALFQMMGVFAEFERAIIVDRINAGLARARANGVVLGRPKIRAQDEERVRKELAKGTGVLKTAKLGYRNEYGAADQARDVGGTQSTTREIRSLPTSRTCPGLSAERPTGNVLSRVAKFDPKRPSLVER